MIAEGLLLLESHSNKHLGEEGERAVANVQDFMDGSAFSSHLAHPRTTTDSPPKILPASASPHHLDPVQHPPESRLSATTPSSTIFPAKDNCGVEVAANEGVGAVLPWTTPLTRIDLSRHQICDDGAVALALALRQNVRVEELDLSFNRISGEGVAALAASLEDPCCRVARLCLSQNGIGRRGGEHLGRMLTGGGGAGQWGQVACLKELNLAGNSLGDDGVEGLCVGLLGHPCLEILILDGNDIGHDGTEHLADALLHNTSLLKLSLRRNSLLADAAQKLAKMLLRNGSIKTLDLAYNAVGPEGLRRLSVFLSSNTGLESLGLRGCGLQPGGVKPGIYALARGLHDNRAIRSLDLAANELNEYAGQELAHALLKNKT